jgi:hypothetical protein
MLELSAYDENRYHKDVVRRLHKVPHVYFTRRSASKEAEPYPLGYSVEHQSTTSKPHDVTSGHLARFLGVRKPPFQTQQLGPYNYHLPDAAQEHLASALPLQPPSSTPPSAPLHPDLRAIAPFGFAGQPTTGSAAWPSTSSTKEGQTRLPQVGGILASHAQSFLDPQHTSALWRRGLLSLRANGDLPPARLATLVAEAKELSDSMAADGGVEAVSAIGRDSVLNIVLPFELKEPARQARRGRRGARSKSDEEAIVVDSNSLRFSLTKIVEVISKAISAIDTSTKSLPQVMEETLKVRSVHGAMRSQERDTHAPRSARSIRPCSAI